MNLLNLTYDCTICDVISRELTKIDKYFNYYLIGTITHLHNIVLMYNLIYNTFSYSFPIRMDAYFVCVLFILLRGKFHIRVHIPSTYKFQ